MTLLLSSALTLIMFSNHPLSLIMALILTTTILALKTFTITKMSFISYSIILVLLGGLIILFIYMASLAPNEPFITNQNKILMTFSFISMMILMKISTPMSLNNFFNFKINAIMLYPIWVTLALSYLLITLIAVVNITSLNSGPLRSTY